MTYETIAARWDLRVCPGCEAGNHYLGFVSGGVIHWTPRRVAKPGLRKFLKMGANVLLGLERMAEPFRTYWENTCADDLAVALGVRFPRKYAELDRARVRAQLASNTTMVPENRWRIERWARDPQSA